MIIITRQRLKFLRAGRTLTIPDNSGRYKRGRDYALGLTHQTTVCRVEVLEAKAGSISIRIAQTDPPRLLAARLGIGDEHGYTSDPMKAMRDEPEAVSPAELARYAQMADAEKIVRSEQTPIAVRVKMLEQRAEAGDEHAKRNLHVIQQRVRAAEERVSRSVA